MFENVTASAPAVGKVSGTGHVYVFRSGPVSWPVSLADPERRHLFVERLYRRYAVGRIHRDLEFTETDVARFDHVAVVLRLVIRDGMTVSRRRTFVVGLFPLSRLMFYACIGTFGRRDDIPFVTVGLAFLRVRTTGGSHLFRSNKSFMLYRHVRSVFLNDRLTERPFHNDPHRVVSLVFS